MGPVYMDLRRTAHGANRRAGHEVDLCQAMSAHLCSISVAIPSLLVKRPAITGFLIDNFVVVYGFFAG